MDVPVVVTALLNEIIGEARQLLQFQAIVIYAADNRASTCCTKVDGKEI